MCEAAYFEGFREYERLHSIISEIVAEVFDTGKSTVHLRASSDVE